MPRHNPTTTLQSFKGINNVLQPRNTTPDYLKKAVNIDIDKLGNLVKRKGYQQVATGVFHSLWSNETRDRVYAVRDGDLVKVMPDYSFLLIRASVGSKELSYTQVDNRVYYCSSDYTGCINQDEEWEPWGINIPNIGGTLTATAGSLPEGVYHLHLTFQTADGVESGALLANQITLTNNSGITITNFPSSIDSNVVSIGIYVSMMNSEEAYYVGSVPLGTTTYTITSYFNGARKLSGFGMYPAPRGHITRYLNGRIYTAVDNIVYYSESFTYGWWNTAESYYYFEEKITAIMPVEDGLWISSDKLYYISGKDPRKARRQEKEPVKVVPGTDVKVPGPYIFIENTPAGYKWLCTTNKGVFILYNDGLPLNMTERNVSLPIATEGVGSFIQEDGINRYVSLLKKKEGSQNTSIGDMATATIIRNGVEIN